MKHTSSNIRARLAGASSDPHLARTPATSHLKRDSGWARAQGSAKYLTVTPGSATGLLRAGQNRNDKLPGNSLLGVFTVT